MLKPFQKYSILVLTVSLIIKLLLLIVMSNFILLLHLIENAKL